jgi:hypothetical protein
LRAEQRSALPESYCKPPETRQKIPRNTLILRENGTGWGGRIRTYGTRYQKALPYHLATPQLCGGNYDVWPGSARAKIQKMSPRPDFFLRRELPPGEALICELRSSDRSRRPAVLCGSPRPDRQRLRAAQPQIQGFRRPQPNWVCWRRRAPGPSRHCPESPGRRSL